MANRALDPAWMESVSLGACSRDARLLFIGLISLADDDGRLRAEPRMLAARVFPMDELEAHQIDAWLEELHQAGSIIRYVVDDRRFVALPKFAEYQKIRYHKPSKLPGPEQAEPIIEEDNQKDELPEIAENCGNSPEITETSGKVPCKLNQTKLNQDTPNGVGAVAPLGKKSTAKYPPEDHALVEEMVNTFATFQPGASAKTQNSRAWKFLKERRLEALGLALDKPVAETAKLCIACFYELVHVRREKWWRELPLTLSSFVNHFDSIVAKLRDHQDRMSEVAPFVMSDGAWIPNPAYQGAQLENCG